MNEKDISIQDDFLTKEKFEELNAIVTGLYFPWHFSEVLVNEDEETDAGLLLHSIYENRIPRSEFYDTFLPIVEALNAIVLFRIRINLTFRLPVAHFCDFHGDMQTITALAQQSQWTTSILYMGTNNGYTELENGQRIESVANRLLSFPASTKHRYGTQTDELRRIVVNFNYLKVDTGEGYLLRPSEEITG